MLEDAGKELLRAAMQQPHLSERAYHRILKLARTTANLAGAGSVETAPVHGRSQAASITRVEGTGYGLIRQEVAVTPGIHCEFA